MLRRRPLRLCGECSNRAGGMSAVAMAEDDRTHSAAGHRGLITVFGGTGFLGRRIVHHLIHRGFQVRTASRHPQRLRSASRSDAGPESATADTHDETTGAAALLGAY